MLRMDANRRVVALVVVLALFLGGPLAAAGWERPAKWMGPGDFLSGIVTRVLVWLGVTTAPDGIPKCGRGSSIDPNGCPRSATTAGATSDVGSSIDPNGSH